MSSLDIKEDRSQRIAILHLTGRLDTVTSADFQKKITELMDGGENQIILNCVELNYVSSAGLRIFLMAQKRVKAKGGGLRLVGVSSFVKEVFDISGFSTLFSFYPTLDEAT